MDERLIGLLQQSKNEADINDSFEKFEVANTGEKIEYLKKAMYSPEVFYSAV